MLGKFGAEDIRTNQVTQRFDEKSWNLNHSLYGQGVPSADPNNTTTAEGISTTADYQHFPQSPIQLRNKVKDDISKMTKIVDGNSESNFTDMALLGVNVDQPSLSEMPHNDHRARAAVELT